MFEPDQLKAAGLDPERIGRFQRQFSGPGFGRRSLPADAANSIGRLVEAGRLAAQFDVDRDGDALVEVLTTGAVGEWDPTVGGPPLPPEVPWGGETPHPMFPDGLLCPDLVIGQTRVMAAAAAVDIMAGRSHLPTVRAFRSRSSLAANLTTSTPVRREALGDPFPFGPTGGNPPPLPGGVPPIDLCDFQLIDCANRVHAYLDDLAAWQAATGRSLTDQPPQIGEISPACVTLDDARSTEFEVTPRQGEQLPDASWVLTFNGETIDAERHSGDRWTFRLDDLPGDGCRSGWIRLEDDAPPPTPPTGSTACPGLGAPAETLGPTYNPSFWGVPFEILDRPIVTALAIDGIPALEPDTITSLFTHGCGPATIDLRYAACAQESALDCARFSTEVDVADGLPDATVTTAGSSNESVRILVDACVDEIVVRTKVWPDGDPDSAVPNERTYRITRRPKLTLELVDPASGAGEILPRSGFLAPTVVAGRERLLRVHTSCCPTYEGLPIDIFALGLVIDAPTQIRIPFGATFVDVPFRGVEVRGAEGEVIIEVSAPDHRNTTGVLRLRQPVLGVALSGGGAKGSFHAGALSYLRDRELFGRFNDSPARFAVVAGTSVGAITGAKLAEGRKSAVDDTVEVWLGLEDTSAMVVAAPWVERIANELRSGLGGNGIPQLPDCHPFVPHPEIQPTRQRRRKRKWYEMVWDVFTAPFRVIVDAGEWLLDQARQIAADLRRLWWVITRADDLVDDLLAAYCDESGVLTLDPAMAIVADHVDARRVGDSGIELRLLAADAASGRVMAFTQNATVLDPGEAMSPNDADDIVLRQTDPDPLIVGVRASSAQPVIHETPLVGVAGADDLRLRMYDGGVREIIPALAAVRAGADDVIVIDLSPVQTRRDEVAPLGGLRTTLERGLELPLTEVEVGDRHAIAHLPDIRTTHIAPSMLVTSPYEIDQGKTRINMMHGWLRAHDALLEDSDAAEERLSEARITTDQLTGLRLQVWACEEQLLEWRAAGLDSLELLEIILGLKRSIRDTAQRRISNVGPASLPRGFGQRAATRELDSDWWLHWERHSAWAQPATPIFDGTGEAPPAPLTR